MLHRSLSKMPLTRSMRHAVDKRMLQKLSELESRISPSTEMAKFYENELQGTMNEQNMEKLYAKAVSIFQGMKPKRGKLFEELVENELLDHGISFLRQATIDHDGTIVKSNKNKKGARRPDIIINASEGDHIRDKIVVSIKYSLRERKYEDTSIASMCKKLYLVTMNVKNEKEEYEELQRHNINLVVIGGAHSFEDCITNICSLSMP